MDEAERCHRIAILERGALVADDTPLALMKALNGRSLAVDAADPRPLQRLLITLPFVVSVAQIGNRLRVLTTSVEAAAQRLSAAILLAGMQARVTITAPNLEFVAATHQRAVPRRVTS
jgi:ABC-2 type transport system ATP-binding protein